MHAPTTRPLFLPLLCVPRRLPIARRTRSSRVPATCPVEPHLVISCRLPKPPHCANRAIQADYPAHRSSRSTRPASTIRLRPALPVPCRQATPSRPIPGVDKPFRCPAPLPNRLDFPTQFQPTPSDNPSLAGPRHHARQSAPSRAEPTSHRRPNPTHSETPFDKPTLPLFDPYPTSQSPTRQDIPTCLDQASRVNPERRTTPPRRRPQPTNQARPSPLRFRRA